MLQQNHGLLSAAPAPRQVLSLQSLANLFDSQAQQQVQEQVQQQQQQQQQRTQAAAASRPESVMKSVSGAPATASSPGASIWHEFDCCGVLLGASEVRVVQLHGPFQRHMLQQWVFLTDGTASTAPPPRHSNQHHHHQQGASDSVAAGAATGAAMGLLAVRIWGQAGSVDFVEPCNLSGLAAGESTVAAGSAAASPLELVAFRHLVLEGHDVQHGVWRAAAYDTASLLRPQLQPAPVMGAREAKAAGVQPHASIAAAGADAACWARGNPKALQALKARVGQLLASP